MIDLLKKSRRVNNADENRHSEIYCDRCILPINMNDKARLDLKVASASLSLNQNT